MKDIKTIELDKGKQGKCLLKIDPAIISIVYTNTDSWVRTERKNWLSPIVETPVVNARLIIQTTEKVQTKDASWFTKYEFQFDSIELLNNAYEVVKSIMNIYEPKEDPEVAHIVQIMKDTDPDKISRIVEIMKKTT